ncbi:hypothetical protein DPX16_21137 [Anabarilius grahami]|uniref:Uncharacterized protein n=1 Tax=Anabarilius grahami TaxID=495550 RepID=A0A3N0Z328_ANAGA|nr:hypothetical protein DPX16_21137 [Anabarilius grahami]
MVVIGKERSLLGPANCGGGSNREKRLDIRVLSSDMMALWQGQMLKTVEQHSVIFSDAEFEKGTCVSADTVTWLLVLHSVFSMISLEESVDEPTHKNSGQAHEGRREKQEQGSYLAKRLVTALSYSSKNLRCMSYAFPTLLTERMELVLRSFRIDDRPTSGRGVKMVRVPRHHSVSKVTGSAAIAALLTGKMHQLTLLEITGVMGQNVYVVEKCAHLKKRNAIKRVTDLIQENTAWWV